MIIPKTCNLDKIALTVLSFSGQRNNQPLREYGTQMFNIH